MGKLKKSCKGQVEGLGPGPERESELPDPGGADVLSNMRFQRCSQESEREEISRSCNTAPKITAPRRGLCHQPPSGLPCLQWRLFVPPIIKDTLNSSLYCSSIVLTKGRGAGRAGLGKVLVNDCSLSRAASAQV